MNETATDVCHETDEPQHEKDDDDGPQDVSHFGLTPFQDLRPIPQKQSLETVSGTLERGKKANTTRGGPYETVDVWGAELMLEMFCVTGWDDGFVQFVRRDLCASLGASKTDINRAIAELESLHLVVLRIAERHEIAEIIALSTPTLSGTSEICWWQYYRVHFADFWFDLSDESGGGAQKGGT